MAKAMGLLRLLGSIVFLLHNSRGRLQIFIGSCRQPGRTGSQALPAGKNNLCTVRLEGVQLFGLMDLPPMDSRVPMDLTV